MNGLLLITSDAYGTKLRIPQGITGTRGEAELKLFLANQ